MVCCGDDREIHGVRWGSFSGLARISRIDDASDDP